MGEQGEGAGCHWVANTSKANDTNAWNDTAILCPKLKRIIKEKHYTACGKKVIEEIAMVQLLLNITLIIPKSYE